MEEVLISPCGMNCGVCSGYLAMKNNVKSKGIKAGYCSGCLPRSKGCSIHKSKGCEKLMKLRVRYCFECEEFPCSRIKPGDERYRKDFNLSPIENLNFIKENGIDKFFKKEEERWKCPVCGRVISCHNGICYSCGLEKLKMVNKNKQDDD
jgi:hypothetical protein